MKIDKRPWGYENIFNLDRIAKVKLLNINAGQILSLQKHKKRCEMWYFLTEGYAQVGSKMKKIKEGEIVNINKNVAHRLCAKNKPVKVLEISSGHFDEKDEIRLEDKYGRK
jgi:mannose-6-phosphate isomerase-like protein (cupin superfamily)